MTLSREEWDFLAEEMAWQEYKTAPTNVVWMWVIRKQLADDSSVPSRGNRMKMLKRHDRKPMREVIKDMAKNNSALQELLTATQEASRLKEEDGTSNESIDLSTGRSSDGRLGGRLHQRGPEIRPRDSYTETTSGEELHKGERDGGKGTKRDMDPDEEKRKKDK